MICIGCEIWEENERLRAEISQLRKQIAQLEVQNEKLKQRLQIYENPNVPPSRRRYPARKCSNSGKRFPGRPKGYPGKTRPTPKPDVVRELDWKECEICGAPLDPSEYVRHNIIEEISNPTPRVVIDSLQFEGECSSCGAYNVVRHPDCPPDGRFGKNVYVQTTLMKFEERLPFEKDSTKERTSGCSLISFRTIYGISICRFSFMVETLFPHPSINLSINQKNFPKIFRCRKGD